MSVKPIVLRTDPLPGWSLARAAAAAKTSDPINAAHASNLAYIVALLTSTAWHRAPGRITVP
jgi:hypothetical protein